MGAGNNRDSPFVTRFPLVIEVETACEGSLIVIIDDTEDLAWVGEKVTMKSYRYISGDMNATANMCW